MSKFYVEINEFGYRIDFLVASEKPEDTSYGTWRETICNHECEECGGLWGLDANNSCVCGG